MCKRILDPEAQVRHGVEQPDGEVNGSIWHWADLPDPVHNGLLDWAVGVCGHLDS